MRLISLLFLIITLSFQVKSQSLPEEFESIKSKRATDPDSAILLARKAIVDKKYSGNADYMAILHNYLGTAFYYGGNPDAAIESFEKGLSYARKAKNDTIRIHMYNNMSLLSQDYFTYEKSINYCLLALKIASAKKLHCETGDTYNNMGSVNMYYGLLDSAIYYFQLGIKSYQQETVRKALAENGIADINTNLGIIYYNQGKYELSLRNFFTSLKIFEKHKSWYKASTTANSIADLYFEKGDYDKSAKYVKIAIAFNNKEYRKQIMGNSFFIMGKIFQEKNAGDSALVYYYKALSIYDELNLIFQKTILYNSLGTFYADQKDYPKSMEYFYKALAINTSNGDTASMCLNYFNIAFNHYQLSEYPEAKKLNDKAREMLHAGSYYSLYVDIYGQAADIYSKLGQFEKAYFFLQERNIYKDSLSMETSQRRQEEIEAIYQNEKNEKELKLQKSINEKKTLELEHAEKDKQVQAYQIQLMAFGGLVLLIFIFIVIRSNLIRKRNNRILAEKNHVIYQQKAEVELKSLIIEEKQKEITDSINYARRIQYSLLAHEELLKNNLPEFFILFKPKDIVSGDFYWGTNRKSAKLTGNDDFYLAVCDCTGHGVPGAFMSLLNISFLNEAINEKNIQDPAEVLNFVRDRLIKNMEGGKDGMDAILLKFQITDSKYEVSYAAAHNKPVLIRNKEVVEMRADKMPVGKGENEKSFTTFDIPLMKNDFLYLYTDGYADQFGGPKGKKLKSSYLNKLLVEISHLPSSRQKSILESEIENWRGDLEQVDDITIIGIRF